MGVSAPMSCLDVSRLILGGVVVVVVVRLSWFSDDRGLVLDDACAVDATACDGARAHEGGGSRLTLHGLASLGVHLHILHVFSITSFSLSVNPSSFRLSLPQTGNRQSDCQR